MEALLQQLAQSVSAADSAETLTRSLLEMLETVTGMESTYLTRVDLAQGVQHIVFARNSGQMQIPEGLSVEWNDTLCKRALEEGITYTDDVSARWADSVAAQQLGLKTYLSSPVRNLDGGLYGTLCAASGAKVAVPPATECVLGMFAQLIAYQLERERLLDALRRSNAELSSHALIDPLTGIANRRALMQELQRMLARAQRDGETLQLAFIDLDGFKLINDRNGHEEGDRFLVHVAGLLTRQLRAGDLVARYGGDEFIVAAVGSSGRDLQLRLEQLIAGRYVSDSGLVIEHIRASIGVVASQLDDTDATALLARADAAMYEIKKRRRQART